MQNLSKILQSIKNGIPVSLARFGDGEAMSITLTGTHTSRGAQPIYKSMVGPLLDALTLEQENYYVGVPCKICQPDVNQKIEQFINLDYEWLCYGAVFQNRNYQRFLNEVDNGLFDKTWITFVSGEDQDPTKLPFNVDKHIKVPSHDAFSLYEETKKELVDNTPKGGIVLMSCGTLSRALAGNCFKERPNVSFLCIGTIFDPLTLNRKTGRYQEGKLPPCQGCN
jgi:hypothetical protein